VDRKDGIQSENLPGKGAKVKNRNILVFIFFLFLSFALWYLDSLGNQIEADIRYPVTFTHVPGNKALTTDLPSRLILNFKGTGYSILRTKASASKIPLEIDLSRSGYKAVPGGKLSDLYIVTSRLIPGISSRLKSECEITSIKPDTLFFTFK
jgi:hypothetical protein